MKIELQELELPLLCLPYHEVYAHYLDKIRSNPRCASAPQLCTTMDMERYAEKMRTVWVEVLACQARTVSEGIFFEITPKFGWSGNFLLLTHCDSGYSTVSEFLQHMGEKISLGGNERLSAVYTAVSASPAEGPVTDFLVAITLAAFKDILEGMNPEVPVYVGIRESETVLQIF